MPYRLAGRLKLQDRVHAVLAKDKDVVVALQGQKLEDGYRVESIRPDSVTLLYPPKERTKLPFDLVFVPQQQRAYEVGRGAQPIAAQPVTSQPAQLPSLQLRLEGPPQVKAGAPFTVTVKASASEPLSAVPLQLTYDPAVLQVTSMKAGGFFEGGSFTSRADKPGSLSVVVSGKPSQAVDADLLVATFKPLRPGGVAELGVARASPQTGAPEAPLAFRTSIGN